jgi:hypothetical protein
MWPISANMADSETPFSANRVAKVVPEVMTTALDARAVPRRLPGVLDVHHLARRVCGNEGTPRQQVVFRLRVPAGRQVDVSWAEPRHGGPLPFRADRAGHAAALNRNNVVLLCYSGA